MSDAYKTFNIKTDKESGYSALTDMLKTANERISLLEAENKELREQVEAASKCPWQKLHTTRRLTNEC
jgi:hypothetical protein